MPLYAEPYYKNKLVYTTKTISLSKKTMKINKYNAILVLLVFFWGLTFPIAKIMLSYAGVLPSLFFRYAIGASLVVIISLILNRHNLYELFTQLFEKKR